MAQGRVLPKLLQGAELDASLRAVGMRLGVGGAEVLPPSPERVVVSAVAAAFPRDYRLLAVATTWIGVHAARLHVAQLARLLPRAEGVCADALRFRAYWAGIAHWRRSDSRWAKIAKMYAGPAVFLSRLGDDIAEQSIAQRGEDPRFAGSRLRVAQGLLRDRLEDVDPPSVLVHRHAWYRERVRQGPTFRADCWAELERDASQTPADLARRVGCTYPVALHAVQDWKLVA